MPTRIFHFGLTVSDLQRSIPFYRDVLGFEVTQTREGKGNSAEKLTGLPGAHTTSAFLQVGGQTIQLSQYLTPMGQRINPVMNTVGAAHIALYVDDLEALYKRFKEKGIQPKCEMLVSGLGLKAGAVLDPDGHTIEIFEAKKEPAKTV